MDFFLSSTWWLLKAIGIVFLLYALAFLLLPLITVNNKATSTNSSRLAYLHGNGIHVDLIFSTKLLSKAFMDSIDVDPAAKYVAFGWGDQGFYLNTPTWAELSVKTAVVAALINSPTAMHVTDHFAGDTAWRKVPLSEQQLSDLLDYLKSGFARTEAGKVIPIPNAGYTKNDRFFQGTGSYTALQTCNTWVNAGLKKTGIKTAFWVGHENGLLRHFPEAYNKE